MELLYIMLFLALGLGVSAAAAIAGRSLFFQCGTPPRGHKGSTPEFLRVRDAELSRIIEKRNNICYDELTQF